jgi:antitoxin YefM
MTIYTITEARENFFQMVRKTVQTHEPTYIKSKKGNVVIISEEDYEGLQETLAIYSVPGLAKEILDASNSPSEEWISDTEFWKE